MKKLLYISILSFTIIGCGSTEAPQVGNKTSMIVNKTFDAGTVVRGEIIKAKFTVKNTGDFPLVIADVKGSCSCTVASKPDAPIQPGDEAVIKAEVDTERTSTGSISKSVRIVANTEPSVTEVGIKATVKNN